MYVVLIMSDNSPNSPSHALSTSRDHRPWQQQSQLSDYNMLSHLDEEEVSGCVAPDWSNHLQQTSLRCRGHLLSDDVEHLSHIRNSGDNLKIIEELGSAVLS